MHLDNVVTVAQTTSKSILQKQFLYTVTENSPTRSHDQEMGQLTTRSKNMSAIVAIWQVK